MKIFVGETDLHYTCFICGEEVSQRIVGLEVGMEFYPFCLRCFLKKFKDEIRELFYILMSMDIKK